MKRPTFNRITPCMLICTFYLCEPGVSIPGLCCCMQRWRLKCKWVRVTWAETFIPRKSSLNRRISILKPHHVSLIQSLNNFCWPLHWKSNFNLEWFDYCHYKTILYMQRKNPETRKNKAHTILFISSDCMKLTKSCVKSWVKPWCGFVLVVDVVNFSFWCKSLFPAIREWTCEMMCKLVFSRCKCLIHITQFSIEGLWEFS